MVGIAQLVRAPDCGSGGHGFKSHYPPFAKVLTKYFLILMGHSQAVRHKTLTLALGGSNPPGPVETLAQSVEHLTFNQVVGGSIPPCHTQKILSNQYFFYCEFSYGFIFIFVV